MSGSRNLRLNGIITIIEKQPWGKRFRFVYRCNVYTGERRGICNQERVGLGIAEHLQKEHFLPWMDAETAMNYARQDWWAKQPIGASG